MLRYAQQRIIIMIPTLLVITLVTFFIIQLPPGDFMHHYLADLDQNETVDKEILEAMRARYGLDQPIYVQYWKWIRNMFRGDLGQSFQWNQPVAQLIGDRIGLTFVISFSTLIMSWLLAIPIGVYSATHQYSILDYLVFGLLTS